MYQIYRNEDDYEKTGCWHACTCRCWENYTFRKYIIYFRAIRKLGRVDNKDAFLDNNEYERQRGITIFSKQACFSYMNLDVTLLDTPGHVDFSAEMERTLWVLDYAVLVINGMDGVQGHTDTLWGLLKDCMCLFLYLLTRWTSREPINIDFLNSLRISCHQAA